MHTFQESVSGKQNHAVRAINQRMAFFCTAHWDINAVWQLGKDINETLEDTNAVTSRNDRKNLASILEIFKSCLIEPKLPSDDQNRMLTFLSGELSAQQPDDDLTTNSQSITAPKFIQSTRLETPPSTYWRQWSDAIQIDSHNSGLRVASPNNTEAQSTRTIDMTEAKSSADALHSMLQSTGTKTTHFRIYHLSDYSALSLELDIILEKEGIDLELLNNVDELSELLHALPADLVIIDAGFSGNSNAIQAVLKSHRQFQQQPLLAVWIGETTSDSSKTVSPDAIDTSVNQSLGSRAIVDKIEQLLHFDKSGQFRVLIVEDDRSQAMFAEGILRNADIATKVLLESDHLMEHIDEFKPDLILMDLHMPNANGIELTELIRANPFSQDTPVVFLSGEADEELQADALEAGGDDFLTKPIRPRRLIAAVHNRIKRHRAMYAMPQSKLAVNNTGTGLMHRTDMLDLLKSEINRTDKALMFIELNGFGLLKERLGLTSLENLLKEFSSYLVKSVGSNLIARFGDGSFVMIYTGDCADNILESYAAKLRAQLMAQHFIILDQHIELRIHIGICHFEYMHGNADLLINVVERTARHARSAASGLALHKPQSNSELQKEERIILLLSDIDSNHCLSHIYQPIVAVAGSEEKQFQTLLRLCDSNGQIVSAAEFIPIAEKSNLIIAIDRWSISKAVSVIVDKMANGVELKLFVNQSNITMLDPEQMSWLKNLIKAQQLPENSLIIEINHDDAMMNQHSIDAFCQSLVFDGVQFCLSRYNPKNDESNLMESLPISYLKLAQKFTSDIASQQVRTQVKDLVERAHRRGIEVIGHSVEDVHTAAMLWMSGIDYIQGNLVQSATTNMDFGFDQSVL